MLQNRSLITLLFNLIVITGCSKEIPANPACRIKPSLNELAPAPAVCLVSKDNKLLVLQYEDSDDWYIPQGKAQKSQSAQCTAHQAVWKNTGLNVEVAELLVIASDNTHYFTCHLTDELSQQIERLSVPEWANIKVKNIEYVDPFELTKNNFTAAIELPKIREAFIEMEKTETSKPEN
ncbi:NUDIX domain-containing protein [Paraglaciecola sp. 2405UD69-4]|uniref:NUDIX domain-containing protein n=1 Tax=Paraglaciecola sp. 2405UD69-4 TaxID=3391836 RepID=UPI0039C8DA49